MSYSREEIEKYLEILRSLSKKEQAVKSSCCESPSFIIESGYHLCENCGTTKGHVLGYFDNKEYDRFHFQKKSVYQPKYYYEKKVNLISKSINLSDEEKCELYDRLISIDNNLKKQLNSQFGRKRLINIFYLIKKILEEMGSEKSIQVYLRISKQTLQKYNNWWENYKKLC